MYLRGVNSEKAVVLGLENWISRSTRFINQMQQLINQINIQQSSTKCTSQSTRFNNQICQSINQADVKKNKSTRFREGGDTANLMVPCTQGSVLANELREVLKQNPGPKGTQVRVVEKPGNKVMQGISSNNPFPRNEYSRQEMVLFLLLSDLKP